jgi:hypothetical protein
MGNSIQDSDRLLQEIIRRRNRVWYWVPQGFFILVVTIGVYMGLFGEPPFWLTMALLISWSAVARHLSSRISEIKCPECGDSALKPTLVIFGEIRCQWCGHEFN